MAVKAAEATVELVKRGAGIVAILEQWLAIPNGDTGSVIERPDFIAGTITIEGTFSTGGSCTLEGSNNGTDYYTLKDPQDADITLLAGGIKNIRELPRYMRPTVTAGDGSTLIDVSIKLVRRNL